MRKVLVVMGLLLCTAGFSYAATCPLVETTGSYDYVRLNTTVVVPSGSGLTTPVTLTTNLNGWNAEGAYNITCWLGAVAQFSGLYATPSVEGTPVTLHVYPSLFGARVNVRRGIFTFFGEGLGGFAHGNISSAGFGFSSSTNKAAGGVGGGVDIGFSPHAAIRFEADDLITTFFSTTQNNARVIGAVVIMWGSH